MVINVQTNYITFTAETQEESAKLAEAALLMRQNGYDTVHFLAYKTIEIPLCGLTRRAADSSQAGAKSARSRDCKSKVSRPAKSR